MTSSHPAPLWTAADAAQATGGQATGNWGHVTGLSIDSRSLRPGEVFVALRAARDGHDFVADALRRGAAAAMVERRPDGLPADAPLLLVRDAMEGLVALARAGRARSRARVVAVTGSVGKTSTKEMLRVVLGGQGRVHAAEASLNNHWGVPLTLARLPAGCDFAVIEIGMNAPGEIAPLARMARPDAVMITTIAPAHLEALGSLEAIAREKGSICEGLARGGSAILPAGLAQTPILIDAARAVGARIVRFGPDPAAEWRLGEIHAAATHSRALAEGPAGPIPFEVRAAGGHFAANALGVLAMAAALDLDVARAARDLALWQPPAGRGNRRRIGLNGGTDAPGFDLIDDAFNANPASMAAALAVLASCQPGAGGRRVAVLGDMLELGPDAPALHAGLADLSAMAAVDTVHCAGPLMAALWQALPPARRGIRADSAAELARHAAALVAQGDVVLVKGSKGSRVSAVAEALAQLGPAAGALTGDGGECSTG
jgi:UDP-N-acetylmuramoyl-tripeptide--D-alanyl-D-alanine ligase